MGNQPAVYTLYQLRKRWFQYLPEIEQLVREKKITLFFQGQGALASPNPLWFRH